MYQMNTPITLPGTSLEIRHENKTWFNLVDLGNYLECNVKQRASTKNKWDIKLVKGKDTTGRRRNLKYIKNTSIPALLKRCKDETKATRIREACLGAERRTPEQQQVVQAIRKQQPRGSHGSQEADFIELWLNYFPQPLRLMIQNEERYAMLWKGLTRYYPGLLHLPEIPPSRQQPRHQMFLVQQPPFIYGMRLNKGYKGRKRDELLISFTDLVRCFNYIELDDVEEWVHKRILPADEGLVESAKLITTRRMDDKEDAIEVTHYFIPCDCLKDFWANSKQQNGDLYELLVDRVAEFQG